VPLHANTRRTESRIRLDICYPSRVTSALVAHWHRACPRPVAVTPNGVNSGMSSSSVVGALDMAQGCRPRTARGCRGMRRCSGFGGAGQEAIPKRAFGAARAGGNRPSSPSGPGTRLRGSWRPHGGYMSIPGQSRPRGSPFRPVWQVKSEGERAPLTPFLYIINKYFLDYLFSMTRVLKPHLHLHSSLRLTPALFTPRPPPDAPQGLLLAASGGPDGASVPGGAWTKRGPGPDFGRGKGEG
jgi:hypothetical protein